MNVIDKAYASGMERVFVASGMSKTASHRAANIITGFVKQADMFNFSDLQDFNKKDPGFQWSKIIIPLLAALASGTLMYNAGLEGSKRRSVFENTKNYVGGKMSKLVRDTKVPSLFSNFNNRGKW